MKAKEYLRRAYNLDKFIDASLLELLKLRDQCNVIKSLDYSKDKVKVLCRYDCYMLFGGVMNAS